MVIKLSGFKFKCKDVGMKDCDFEVKGVPTKDEMMQIVSTHAKQAHRIDTISPDLASKVSAAIKS